MTAPVVRSSERGRSLIRFARFCVVGGIGFLVDAGVLLGLIESGVSGPISGRVVSFAAAVIVTYLLNRRWSFGVGNPGATFSFAPLLAYLGVQGVGFLTNLLVYTAALYSFPPWLASPLLCVAIASAAALGVNYIGADRLVFADRDTPAKVRAYKKR